MCQVENFTAHLYRMRLLDGKQWKLSQTVKEKREEKTLFSVLFPLVFPKDFLCKEGKKKSSISNSKSLSLGYIVSLA